MGIRRSSQERRLHRPLGGGTCRVGRLAPFACRLLVACALVAATIVAGCTPGSSDGVADGRERVVIAATTFPASAPVFIAEEKGFFADQGLDAEVRVQQAGRLALGSAMSGESDFALVAETPIAAEAMAGRSLRVIATLAEMDGANYIVARRDRGIESATDLRGKRVGVIPGTTGDFFFSIYLIASGIDPESVARVEYPAAGIVEAVVEGDVDAISAWPPFTTKARSALGNGAVVLDEPGLYQMCWNVVVPADARGRSVSEVRFLRAIVEAERFMEARPIESISITARRSGVDEESLAELWPGIRWRADLDQTLLLSLEDEARWLARGSKEASAVPDFLDIIDATALRRVNPAGVSVIEVR